MAKRRANGEGCIVKRKDGRWEAKYTDKFERNPKKKRKSIMGKSRKEVFDKLVRVLNDMRHGEGLPVEATFTVKEWFETWMNLYGIIAYKDTTYSNYNMIISAHIIPHIGSIRLFQLSTIHIQKMLNSLYANGSKRTGLTYLPSTLYKIKTVLSKGLNQAVANKLIAENPIKGLVLPSLNNPEIKFFTTEELYLLSKIVQENSFGILIAVLLATGLRISELLALELNDIDFNHKIININKSVSYTQNKLTKNFEFIVNTPKTKNGIRRLHIMSNLEMLLKKQLFILETSNEYQESKLLFPASNGSYQTQGSIRKRFAKLQKSMNISEIKNIHSLRHTFVINALNAGVTIQNLCKVIGHSNGSITLKVYAHYLDTEAYKQLLELDKFHEQIFEGK